MLARGALYPRAAHRKAVFLGVVHGFAAFLQIFFHIAIGRFILHTRNRARLEHIFLAEQALGVAVHLALVFAREVQVDIRLFIAVEAQKGFKGDIVAVHQHMGAAVGAVFIRQVKAVAHAAIGDKFTVLAVGAAVMRRQAVHLGNAGKVRHGAGANRASAAHLIAALVGIGHQLDRDHIQHGIAMAANGIQLLLQALFHNFGQWIAIILFGAFPCGIAQLLLGTLDAGRVGAPGNGAQVVVDGHGDLVGIGDADLKGFLFGQIVKLLQHILGGAEIQRRLIVGILKAAARLQYGAVGGVLGVLKMHIARGNHRLVQLFAQANDRAVEILQLFHRIHRAVAQHEFVVAQRLHLKIIIIGGNAAQLVPAAALHNGPEQFTLLTRRAHNKAFAVFVQQAAGHTRFFKEILGMRRADNAVQVF